MLMGWWKISDMEELQALMKTLHSRGIRERALHKQLQKSIELISQTCNKNKEGEAPKHVNNKSLNININRMNKKRIYTQLWLCDTVARKSFSHG